MTPWPSLSDRTVSKSMLRTCLKMTPKLRLGESSKEPQRNQQRIRRMSLETVDRRIDVIMTKISRLQGRIVDKTSRIAEEVKMVAKVEALQIIHQRKMVEKMAAEVEGTIETTTTIARAAKTNKETKIKVTEEVVGSLVAAAVVVGLEEAQVWAEVAIVMITSATYLIMTMITPQRTRWPKPMTPVMTIIITKLLLPLKITTTEAAEGVVVVADKANAVVEEIVADAVAIEAVEATAQKTLITKEALQPKNKLSEHIVLSQFTKLLH